MKRCIFIWKIFAQEVTEVTKIHCEGFMWWVDELRANEILRPSKCTLNFNQVDPLHTTQDVTLSFFSSNEKDEGVATVSNDI